MKRFFAIVAAVVFLLVSCGKADVMIRTDLENTRPSALTREATSTVMTAATNEEGLMIFIVNTSSKTFHVSEECRHVKSMSEKNKKSVASHSVEEMVSLGYSPCATCVSDIEKD